MYDYSAFNYLKNRIDVFKTLGVRSKTDISKIYQDVIWDTAVPRYKTLDGEENIVALVRKYTLTHLSLSTDYNKQFIIRGQPPIGTMK